MWMFRLIIRPFFSSFFYTNDTHVFITNVLLRPKVTFYMWAFFNFIVFSDLNTTRIKNKERGNEYFRNQVKTPVSSVFCWTVCSLNSLANHQHRRDDRGLGGTRLSLVACSNPHSVCVNLCPWARHFNVAYHHQRVNGLSPRLRFFHPPHPQCIRKRCIYR